jgi:hypothetical protein
MTRRIALTLSVCLAPSAAFADPLDFTSGGSDADVTAAVNAFRAAINSGGANPNVQGSFVGGRREINWDAVPDSSSSPNALPFDFFNQPATGRARGVQFFTPGAGFLVSADNNNPTGTPVNFSEINASYAAEFRPFSPQRLFAASGSTSTEVRFYIPGQAATRANTSAFGVVFTDVDLPDSTRIVFFNEQGAAIHTLAVPASTGEHGGFSFAGCVFTGGEKIWRVLITCGNTPLGANDNPGAGVDVVAMDDFLYAEPIPATNPVLFASGADDQGVTDSVNAYRDALGTLNANNPGSVGSGRREINWDGVPDASSSPNAFPGDFFNGANPGRARGVVFSTPGSGFQVSADSDNPTATPPEFANIDPSYAALFRPFSPQRLFAPIGSTITTTNFFVPGEATPADCEGFGAVFSDVDINTSTRVDWIDRNGGLLASYYVPVGSTPDESFSFIGAKFDAPYRVASVRITTGSAALGAGVVENVAGGTDLVVMDDFVYAEPVAISSCAADIDGSGVVNSSDFFTFLNFFFAQAPEADFDHDGIINSNDFYVFLTSFFLGC